MMSRLMSCAAALVLLWAAAPAAAQWVNPDTCSWSAVSCQQAKKERSDSDAAYEETAKHRAQVARAEQERQRQALLKAPPLPAERNALLGNWRLEAGQRSTVGGPGRGSGRDAVVRELMGALSIERLKDIGCEAGFSGGVSFTPSTYKRSGMGGVVGGAIAYRTGERGAKQVTVAIPNDGQAMMGFEVASTGRIVSEDGCVLVRGDAPATHAAATVTTTAGNARTAPGSARDGADAVVDGATFRCPDGSLLQVSFCQGDAAPQATCKLTELHLPGLQMGKLVPRSEIAARVKSCDAGGIRYGADDKPVFVR